MIKIRKKPCLEFADSGWRMAGQNGLMFAEQIDYILRTEIRIVDHHRLLILYVYSRKEAAAGNFTAKWIMFQNWHDYTTLERQKDGSVKWRSASFYNLGEDESFVKRCTFYSGTDWDRVSRYFRSEENGMEALLQRQCVILKKRLERKQRRRERKIVERMQGLASLPKNLDLWARRTILPAYFFYDYQKGKRTANGVCSACGNKAVLESVKYNKEGVCPNCGRNFVMKAQGRRGRIYDRETCQVLQKTGASELVIRVMKFEMMYGRKETQGKLRMYENARIFVSLDDSRRLHYESFFYQYRSGILTDWKGGFRPQLYPWQISFAAELGGHIYTRNVNRVLKGTPWQYCPIQLFYEHRRRPVELTGLLKQYLQHPRLEHLIKTGFYLLADGLVYETSPDVLFDEGKNRTHQILKVAAEDISYLRDRDVSLFELQSFQKYCQIHLRDRQRLLDWQREHEVKRDLLQILPYTTVHKMLRYLDKQFSFLHQRKNRYGSIRYNYMQALVSEYRDYLEMCAKLSYDLKNSFVLYPKDLQKSHDKAAHRIKLKADAKMSKEFKNVYRQIGTAFSFEWNGMKIVAPVSTKEVVDEGHALHHCVGNYVERVARRESVILFLRKSEEAAKSFYTIELKGRNVMQVRGMNNKDTTKEVQKFIDLWTKKVIQAPDSPLAA